MCAQLDKALERPLTSDRRLWSLRRRRLGFLMDTNPATLTPPQEASHLTLIAERPSAAPCSSSSLRPGLGGADVQEVTIPRALPPNWHLPTPQRPGSLSRFEACAYPEILSNYNLASPPHLEHSTTPRNSRCSLTPKQVRALNFY